MKRRGGPPKRLTGSMPVSAERSPWWESVAERLRREQEGRVVSIEDLASLLPTYPDGRSARPRAAARRLRDSLELLSRGPNGSLGRGAVYRIKGPESGPTPAAREELPDDTIQADNELIRRAIERMTGD